MARTNVYLWELFPMPVMFSHTSSFFSNFLLLPSKVLWYMLALPPKSTLLITDSGSFTGRKVCSLASFGHLACQGTMKEFSCRGHVTLLLSGMPSPPPFSHRPQPQAGEKRRTGLGEFRAHAFQVSACPRRIVCVFGPNPMVGAFSILQ